SLENGDIRLINVDRAGITINTNLPINQTFREIDNPNSVTVQQGISEMQIESGLMPEGAKAGAGIMNTRVEEYSTFIQAMLSVGISAGFTEPETKIKLSGEAGVSVEREQLTHSIIVKFVQSTFTVRLADDLIDTPSDFFANTVTMNDLNKLESNGTMGASNVPLYIESVTYGRFLLFTLTSTTVRTAAKLNAAVEASWDKYANAGGELSAEFELALSSKQTKIFSAGGSEEGANAAVADLDWSKFFVEAPVTTAVPISFVARTLNGKRKVVLIDNAAFEQRGDCESPESLKINLELSNVTLENPKIGTAQYGSFTFRNSQQVGDLLESGEFVTAFNTDKIRIAGKGSQEYSWSIEASDPEIDRFMIRSANNLVHDNQVFEYPFTELNSGRQKRTYFSTNNRGERMRFSYHITKTFIFP
ncbi:MAG: thiol-activated cytolysin family protein, partial [Cyclobacteriaceae bacterium]|nr:thiol-activated cytolysin family protein [Cyclobacteriaceae bacterium]